MKKYIIGGYVRDRLMGRVPHDKDYVVTGSTISEMLSLGFQQVGKNFPVFLHPITKEEYALARTEHKIGAKHGDFQFTFTPDISLREDAQRRDFTCNAIAYDEESKEIIDYFNGQSDIENRIIRVIDADNFKLDPLRILRACRFAAELNFTIEPHTLDILSSMTAAGMLRDLSPERVWQETARALAAGVDSRIFFNYLSEIGGLNYWFAEIAALQSSPEQLKYHASGNTFAHTMCALNRVCDDNIAVKFAVLTHDFGKGTTLKENLPSHHGHDIRGISLINNFCQRLNIPNKYRNFASLFCREHMRVAKFNEMRLAKKYDLVREISANFKRVAEMEQFLRCFYADYFGEEQLNEYSNPQYFAAVCGGIRQIFSIMQGISLKDLSESQQQRITNAQGLQSGKLYREYMLEYLHKKL